MFTSAWHIQLFSYLVGPNSTQDLELFLNELYLNVISYMRIIDDVKISWYTTLVSHQEYL